MEGDRMTCRARTQALYRKVVIGTMAPAAKNRDAFSLIELLVVIGIIGILAALVLPTLAKSKARGDSSACKNHLHQMGLALEMYVDENRHQYPNQVSILWFDALSAYYPLQWTNQAYHCPGYRGEISLFAGSLPHDPLGSYAYDGEGVCSYDSLSPLYTKGGRVSLGLSGTWRNRSSISQSQIIAPSEMLAIGESRHRGERGVPNGSGVFEMYCGNFQDPPIPFLTWYYGNPPLTQRHGKNYNQLFCDGHVASMDPYVLFNPTNSASLWNNDHKPHAELWIGLNFQ